MKKRANVLALLLTVAVGVSSAAPVWGAQEGAVSSFGDAAVFSEQEPLQEEIQIPQEAGGGSDSSQEDLDQSAASQDPAEGFQDQGVVDVEEPGEDASNGQGADNTQETPDSLDDSKAQEVTDFQSEDIEDVEDVQDIQKDGEEAGVSTRDFSVRVVTEGEQVVSVWLEWYVTQDTEKVCEERYRWDADGTWHRFDPLDEGKELEFGASGVYEIGEMADGSPLYWNLNAGGTVGAVPAPGYVWDAEKNRYEYYLTKDEVQEYHGVLQDVPDAVFEGVQGDISLHAGLQTIDGVIYYLNTNGSLKKNTTIQVGDKKYVFGEDGKCERSYKPVTPGWVKKSNGYYYWRLEDGTYPKTGGWYTLEGKKYYLFSGGRRRTGWVTVQGVKYYLDPSTAVMTEGWRKISGYYYYFMPETGKMRRGWMKLNNKYYYFNTAGRRAAGWTTIKEKIYYFDPKTGVRRTGMLNLDGKKYYLRGNGVRATGWVTGTKYTYYFDPKTGAAVTGRKTIGGKSYYFFSTGARAQGRWVRYGGKYYFYREDNGVLCKNGWLKLKDGKYFLTSSGARVTGLQTIGGKQYYFLSNGKLVTNKEEYKIGNNYYNIDANGVAVVTSLAQVLANDKLDQVGRSLPAAFNWSASIPYYSNSDVVPSGYTPMEWFGIYGFQNGRGDCFVMACTFYQMAKALGYEVYYVQGSVPLASGGYGPHGWCEVVIDGTTYVCDPDFQYETGRNGYLITYGTSGTWRYVIGTRY